jgi:hypothetical protein
VVSGQSKGFGTTDCNGVLSCNLHSRNIKSTYLREVVDESNLRLCHMSHVRIADLQRMSSPPIDLFGSSGPNNIANTK